MTWSYSGNPSTSDKDTVRFNVTDTDTNDQLVQDEEINYALTEYGSVSSASYYIALVIYGKFTRLYDKEKAGQVDISRKFLENYWNIVEKWKKIAGALNAVPYCGGISKDEVCEINSNTDRVRPYFTEGMGDSEDERMREKCNGDCSCDNECDCGC